MHKRINFQEVEVVKIASPVTRPIVAFIQAGWGVQFQGMLSPRITSQVEMRQISTSQAFTKVQKAKSQTKEPMRSGPMSSSDSKGVQAGEHPPSKLMPFHFTMYL